MRVKNRRHWRHIPSRKSRVIAGILAVILVVGLGLGFCNLMKSPLGWAWLPRSRTYPFASLLGIQLGGLDAPTADARLAQAGHAFASKTFALSSGPSVWQFKLSDLGISLDAQAEARQLWALNQLSQKDRAGLVGSATPVIKPVIVVHPEQCQQKLAALQIADQPVQDASFYFDDEVKIRPSQTGSHFNAAATCTAIAGQIRASHFQTAVSLDRTSPATTTAELQARLADIQSLVGRPVTFAYGSYVRTLPSAELFALLNIAKTGGRVSITWADDRLNALTAQLAAHTDAANPAPAVGGCDYVISNGGHWLDRTAVKRFMQNLGGSSPRSLGLPVSYAAPQIGRVTPVAHGNKTIYLTFDDGLLYGDTIMNYAACYGIKVTFFEIGSRTQVDAAALRRAIAEGHAVQSHAYDHDPYAYGTGHDYAWQYNDIHQSIDAITAATGVRPTLFRPPGANRTADTYAAAAANSITLVLWGLSSEDTAGWSSAQICSNVLSRAFDGASVLMHSSKATTAGAVPCIIQGLAARGYTMAAWR